MSEAWYNEPDPDKAMWLEELIKAGLIAPGVVDRRSIKDVQASDLLRFTQCHFFAGIGIWSYALRLAGWPDARPVWTGSCPCPSFSAAGKGRGFDDPRHLWPDWARLIPERRPPAIFGEQVDDAIGYGWLDLVQTDLEGAAYSVGKAVLGACSVGAPHIRQRLYFCALDNAPSARYNRSLERAESDSWNGEWVRMPCERCGPDLLADAEQHDGRSDLARRQPDRRAADGRSGAVGELADADGLGPGDGVLQRSRQHGLFAPDSGVVDGRPAGPLNGFWRDADWLRCWDGKWRPVRPGSFPLVAGAPARVVRLRGYGDGICAETAQAFIEAFMNIGETE